MNALQKRLNAPSQLLSDSAPMEQILGGRDSFEWSYHEEERFKWLRIVDVKLEEGQVAPSFMSEDSIAVTTDDTGYGRLNRCLRTDHDGGDITNGGGGLKERCKLAVVVEDTRTVHNWLSLLYCQAGGMVLPHLALVRTDLRLDYVRGSSAGNTTVDSPFKLTCPPRL